MRYWIKSISEIFGATTPNTTPDERLEYGKQKLKLRQIVFAIDDDIVSFNKIINDTWAGGHVRYAAEYIHSEYSKEVYKLQDLLYYEKIS